MPIAILRPTGAGAFSEWIPTSGTNWAAASAVGGASVSTVTDGARDRYALDDLPADAATVTSVTAWGFLGASASGVMVRFTLDLAGTESNGASFEAADGGYDDASTAFALAPGGLAWTVARVNALTGGPDAVSGAMDAPVLDAFWLAVDYSTGDTATVRTSDAVILPPSDNRTLTLDGDAPVELPATDGRSIVLPAQSSLDITLPLETASPLELEQEGF